MVLDWLLGRKRGAGADGAASEPSAADYVDWLLSYMERKFINELVVSGTRTLPDGSELPDGKYPHALPTFSTVLNCLKVLSGLTPMHQPKPVVGRIERRRGNHNVVFETCFDDTARSPSCKLRLGVRRHTA